VNDHHSVPAGSAAADSGIARLSPPSESNELKNVELTRS
jgi:hypothetical protein